MLRIGFSGIPSSGKTFTARYFSATYKYSGNYLKTELISEYARSYLTKYGMPDSIWEQYKIVDKQIQLEDSVSSHVELLITDSPIQLGFNYAVDLRNVNNKKEEMVLRDIYHKISKLNSPPRYDIIFHLPPLLKPDVDGVRPSIHLDETWREETDKNISYLCKVLFPPKKWVLVEPTDLKERVEFCSNVLTEYIKENSIVKPKSKDLKITKPFLESFKCHSIIEINDGEPINTKNLDEKE